MFEVGKKYRFRLNEPEERGELAPVTFQATVLEVDMPLIKIKLGPNEQIINTHSQAFIGAEAISN